MNIFWFRRDLRLRDNTGLYHALHQQKPVIPVFIFDTNILDQLEDPADKRVSFIYDQVQSLQKQLVEVGSSLVVFHGTPLAAFEEITQKFKVTGVYANHDYEPYARIRDERIEDFLKEVEIPFYTFKDQVIFEKSEIMKDDEKPYTVFTPYSNKWKRSLTSDSTCFHDTSSLFQYFYKHSPRRIPTLQEMGFTPINLDLPEAKMPGDAIKNYDKTRDYPYLNATSLLGVHLRFGTISIRELVKFARHTNEQFLSELIWREFFQMILWQFPFVVQRAFRPQYDHIQWRNDEAEFGRWCEGKTGYPMIDAGMRQLNETGFMHNRVRMIVANFLTRLLLIDWRWGEAYFAKKLLDYELASNNGNWQWAAGSGCDAAPYFRIFNPQTQIDKFDKNLVYIRKWIPELGTDQYPQPMVDYTFARKRALQIYGDAVQNSR